MNSICRFTIPASRDIEQILDRLAIESSLDTSDQFLDLINQKCRRLAQFPRMGRSRPELGWEMRSFPVSPYLIFYRPIAFGTSGAIKNGVEIVRVVSGYQDLRMLFTEDDE
jgi:toxin ParE1/3/4